MMTCNRCAAMAETVAPTAGAGHVESNWAGNRAHPQYCDDCHGFLRRDGGCTRCEVRFWKSRDAIVNSLFGEGATIYPAHPQHRAWLDKAAAMARQRVSGTPQGELRRMVEHNLIALREAKSPGRRLYYARQVDALAQGQPIFRATGYGDGAVRSPGAILRLEAGESGNGQHLEAAAERLQVSPEDVCDHLDRQFQSAQWGATCEEALTHYAAGDGRAIEMMEVPPDAQRVVDMPDGTLWAWNTTVRTDGETLAMAVSDSRPKMRLSCGHTIATSISPGSEEWCAGCDDFVIVAGPAAPVPATSGASSLSEPWRGWSHRRMQLWQTLEDKAKSLGMSRVKDDWSGYAPSAGKGDGKVYGGFYGQGADGQWYSVVAYGPIERAAIQEVKSHSSEVEARRHYSGKAHSKLSGKYSSRWPCDGRGH